MAHNNPSELLFGSNESNFVDISSANHSMNNIICKNCIFDFDGIACLRGSAVGFLSFVTSILCAIRIYKLHRPSRVHYHKLLLFYVLLIQSMSGSLEWILGWKTEAALVSVYARSLELLIIFHLYLTIACRLSHCTERTSTNKLSMSGLTVMVVYFTTLVYTGLLVAIEPWRDCHAPYWIWMSAGNVITVQLIVVSLITIIYRLKGSVFTDNRRRNYKCEFYSLLWAFETSSLADLAYHITLYMIANEDEGCNGVFKHDQILYTTVKVPYELISFFMPIWIILFVFRAHSKSFDEEDSNSSTLFTACSTRSLNNVIVVRNWHRRYRPLGSSQWSFVNPSEEVASRRQSLSSCRNPISSRAFTSSRAHQVQRASQNSKPPPVFRRTQSAPSLTPLLRRNSVSTSVIVSPLYSIPEETSQAQLSSSSSSDNLSTVANVDSDH